MAYASGNLTLEYKEELKQIQIKLNILSIIEKILKNNDISKISILLYKPILFHLEKIRVKKF